MTIASQTSRISYTGDGSTTTFAVPFYFQANGDIVVYLLDASGNQTYQVLGTNYNLTGATVSSGGTCTFVTAPTTGYTVTIYRDPPITQTTSYNNNDPFPAKAHELALDKGTTIDQRTRDLVSRAIHISDAESAFTVTTLPPIASRKNKLLGFDNNGALVYAAGPSFVGNTATGVAVVDSRATAATSTFAVSVNIIRTHGYATPGDLGGATYVRAGGTGPGSFQSADSTWWALAEPTPNVKMFGAVGNGANSGVGADDTAALAAAALYNPIIRLTDGTFRTTSAITLAGAGAGIIGNGPGRSVILVTSTTAKGVVLPTGINQPFFKGFKIARDTSTVATSGATGLDLTQGTNNQGAFEDILIDGAYIGVQMGSTDSARASRVTIQNCISHGILMTPAGANSQMQWQLDNVLSVQNGGYGIRLLSTSSVSQLTMGEWRSVQTFANTGRGISCEGLSGHPIQGLRIRDCFLGNDGDDELYLDTFSTNAYAHLIESPYIEAAGTDVTGPALGTAASHIGRGIFCTANNFIVEVTNPTILNNSLEGIKSSASHLIVNGGSVCNNGLATPNTYAGINVVAGRGTVDGARISDSVAGLSQKYGIILALGTDGNLISNNDLRLFFTGAIQNLSTGTTNKIVDNLGWNPAATQTQPTPGASPWTYTAGPQPETIYVFGGTVTSIGFVPSGLLINSPATVPLGPNESIIITYTVAPSIVKVVH